MERKNSGSSRRGSWFAEHEKAEHGRESLIRLLKFFGHEKMLLTVILAVVLMGTACALIIPALQSHAVDIIAGEGEGRESPPDSRALCRALRLLQRAADHAGVVLREAGAASHQASEAGSLQSDDHAADRLH